MSATDTAPAPHTATARLYQEDVYRTSCTAAVLDSAVSPEGACAVVLSQTVFYPEGGGQGSDCGMLQDEAGHVWDVTYVYEEEATICHVVTPKSEGAPASPAPGATVTAQIDWARRFENMQRHLGEHILSGRFHALFEGTNRGFHMGDDYMTIDIRFENADGTVRDARRLTEEMALRAEEEANAVIWQDLPVTVTHLASAEEAARLPLRKAPPVAKDISVVTVGDPAGPADCCACCGTHPSSTGQVGLIKIYKIEKNKDMWRVYFDAGSRALTRCRLAFDVATKIADRHSTDLSQLLLRIDKEEARQEALQRELQELRKWRTDAACEEIRALLAPSADKGAIDEQTSRTVTVYIMEGASTKDFAKAAKRLQKEVRDLLAVSFPSERTVVLLAGDAVDAGALVRDVAAPLGGKGGGSTTSARVTFAEDSARDAFLELLHRDFR